MQKLASGEIFYPDRSDATLWNEKYLCLLGEYILEPDYSLCSNFRLAPAIFSSKYS